MGFQGTGEALASIQRDAGLPLSPLSCRGASQNNPRSAVMPAGGRRPVPKREYSLSSLMCLQEIKPKVEKPASILSKMRNRADDGCSPGGWGGEVPEATKRKKPRDTECSRHRHGALGAEDRRMRLSESWGCRQLP